MQSSLAPLSESPMKQLIATIALMQSKRVLACGCRNGHWSRDDSVLGAVATGRARDQGGHVQPVGRDATSALA